MNKIMSKNNWEEFNNNKNKKSILVTIEKFLKSLFFELKINLIIFLSKKRFNNIWFNYICLALIFLITILLIKPFNSIWFNYICLALIFLITITFLRNIFKNKNSKIILITGIRIIVSGLLVAFVVRFVNFFVFPLIQEYVINKYPDFSLKIFTKVEKANWKIKHTVNKAKLAGNPYNFNLPYDMNAWWGNRYLSWFFQKLFIPTIWQLFFRRISRPPADLG